MSLISSIPPTPHHMELYTATKTLLNDKKKSATSFLSAEQIKSASNPVSLKKRIIKTEKKGSVSASQKRI